MFLATSLSQTLNPKDGPSRTYVIFIQASHSIDTCFSRQCPRTPPHANKLAPPLSTTSISSGLNPFLLNRAGSPSLSKYTSFSLGFTDPKDAPDFPPMPPPCNEEAPGAEEGEYEKEPDKDEEADEDEEEFDPNGPCCCAFCR